jgi:hypothetical protein
MNNITKKIINKYIDTLYEIARDFFGVKWGKFGKESYETVNFTHRVL